jgi:hypothetical protein
LILYNPQVPLEKFLDEAEKAVCNPTLFEESKYIANAILAFFGEQSFHPRAEVLGLYLAMTSLMEAWTVLGLDEKLDKEAEAGNAGNGN